MNLGERPTSTPESVEALLEAVRALTGHTLREIAAALGRQAPRGGVRGKGHIGELLEAALGAEGKSAKIHDFPSLGVELKTVPLGPAGRPRESTYVCTLNLAEADTIEWSSSWIRSKLALVLWVPIDHADVTEDRRVGRARLWTPSEEEERVLRDDFEDLLGRIATRGIEAITARDGVALQIRPKAANGRVRTTTIDAEGGWVSTVPRGFYLRTSFTERVLAGA